MRTREAFTLLIALLSLFLTKSCGVNNLRRIYTWKALEFAFPSARHRELAIKQGQFIPGAPVPIDVDVYHGDKETSKVFVSIPRFQNGVPATLGYVTDQTTPEGNPVIAPYPNWDFHKLGYCDGITSVYRMQVDECNRLWVLDTGKLGERQICRPQLHVFHLPSNKLLHQYKFPRDQFKPDSLFVTIAVDVRESEKCRDTFAYIADVTGFGLIVYDHRNTRSWRINNNLFYPYPPHGTFNIGGETFDLMDGILGLALSPVRRDGGDRTLYFHSLASRVEGRVPTSVIRNHTLFAGNPDAAPRSFKAYPLERTSQSAAQVMDADGVLYFGLMSDLAIACWNSRNYPQYGGENIETLLVQPETLQFASGMKVTSSSAGQLELWVITTSFQRYMTGSLNPNETNFRIMAGFVNELVRGTKCDVPSLNILGGRLQHPEVFSE